MIQKELKQELKKEDLILGMHKMFSGRYYYGTGRRKTSTSKVRLYENGEGKIIINGIELKKYFHSDLELVVKSPLVLTGNLNNFNITISVEGGGLSGQADAVRLGISRALVEFNSSIRGDLKKDGHLTRDPRKRERKKPGLKRARKAPTFVKR